MKGLYLSLGSWKTNPRWLTGGSGTDWDLWELKVVEWMLLIVRNGRRHEDRSVSGNSSSSQVSDANTQRSASQQLTFCRDRRLILVAFRQLLPVAVLRSADWTRTRLRPISLPAIYTGVLPNFSKQPTSVDSGQQPARQSSCAGTM